MKLERSEQINEISLALSKAQAEIQNPSRNSTNPHFKSKYADLAEVLSVVRPAFSAHGLSISQHPTFEAGVVTVESLLSHSSGQWIVSAVSSPVAKLDAQGVGSAITYCRRYALAAIAGVAQDDDDGNAAVAQGKNKEKPKDARAIICNNIKDSLIKIYGENKPAMAKMLIDLTKTSKEQGTADYTKLPDEKLHSLQEKIIEIAAEPYRVFVMELDRMKTLQEVENWIIENEKRIPAVDLEKIYDYANGIKSIFLEN